MRVFLFLTIFPLVFFASAQSYIEEISTLESIYESQARTVLNTLLRPDEYSIIVSAEINRDKDKIKQYQDQLNSEVLPGMPEPDPQASVAANELDSLKSSVTIHLVLKNDVPDAKEKLIYQVLQAKLHLDTSLGDKIVIQKTVFPGEKERLPASAKPLPEPSYKLIGLILGGGLLLLLMLALLLRRKNKDKVSEKDKKEDEQPQQGEVMDLTGDALTAEGSSDSTPSINDQILIDKIQSHVNEVIQMSAEYPSLTTKALAEFYKKEDPVNLLILMQAIGWEKSRSAFNNLPESVWGGIGHLLETTSTDFKLTKIASSVSESAKFILSHILSYGKYGDQSSPFAFLFEVNATVRKALISNLTAREIAIIGFCSSDDEFLEIISLVDGNKQKDVVTMSAEFDDLPSDEILTLSDKLMVKVGELEGSTTVEADGVDKAAKILRLLPPEQEDEVFANMSETKPEKAAKIRQKMVRFSDLPIFPATTLAGPLEQLEIDDLVVALSGQADDFVGKILGLVAPKRAKVVQGDLSYRGDQVSPLQRSAIQRKICLMVEDQIRAQGLELEHIWNDHLKAN